MTAVPEDPPVSLLARISSVALWLLLAGYLLANKPFATLGFPPVYVGEIVLAIAVVAGLARFRPAFLEPLRHSWGLRILALLWTYATARALWDVQTYGLLALRDGAVVGYAIVAFLAPFLWNSLASAGNDSRRLAAHAAGWLLPLSLLGTLASAGMLFGWLPASFNFAVKVDFVTVAAAAGAWIAFIAGLKWAAVGGYYSSARKRDGVYRWVLVAFYFAFSLWAWTIVFRLPTRAVFISVAPLALLLVVARLASFKQRLLAALALLALLGGALYFGQNRVPQFAVYSDRFALRQHTDLSLRELESRTSRALAGDAAAIPEDVRAHFEPLLPFDDPTLIYGAANPAEHSLRWRAVFWARCWNYTLATAPLTGAGFGGNLTALMLPTRAWPDYVDSQHMSPPNRGPHSVHVHLFTRLGLLGLALWLAVLALTARSALRALWYWRTQSGRLAREAYYDTLALFGFWIILLCAASFGVIVEGPFGGIWFWVLTGLLLRFNPRPQEPAAAETERLPATD